MVVHLLEEKNLFLEYSNNRSLELRNRIVNSNLRLVISTANRYIGRGLSLLDLIQEGNLGLIKAVRRFDCSKNVRFSTYACPMIIGEVRRHLRDNGAIRVSRSYKDIAREINGVFPLRLQKKIFDLPPQKPQNRPLWG